ncbi:MAG TPA: iron-sulfur cluster repair di-iron protein [Clostridia bacterium]|nr:iron-sulfur cluster repair di-iron protein [Clostridia bacterium]
MNRFSSTQSIGAIVSALPKAGDVFKEYRIDFCCGGNRPLKEAIREQGLDEAEVLEKLDKAYEEVYKTGNEHVDFKMMRPGKLIDHIVNTHHSYLRTELPIISDYVNTILKVHGKNHGDVLFKVHKLFHSLKAELEQHLVKEEQILFPMIKEYDNNPSSDMVGKIAAVINELEDEHEGAGGILKELREVTDNYTPPEDGCRTYCLTFQKLEELESDLFQHIHLENNILFRAFGADLN